MFQQSDSTQTTNPPQPTQTQPQRTPLKITITSSPAIVTNTIHTLYRLGFAPVSEWSKPQPTQKPGEVISVLIRNVISH